MDELRSPVIEATHDDTTARETFALEVGEYLRRVPRQLPSKYFYDALGSSLFEAICRLPWYRVTRAESRLLSRHARAIVQPLGRPLALVELGCGSGDKLALLAEHAGERFSRAELVDISPAALLMARRRLETAPVDTVVTHLGTYEDGLARITRADRGEGATMVLFLGSNIGNFDPPVAHNVLRAIRGAMRPGDALLLGNDLVKPEAELLLAYDDPLQVTAAFNRNLLRRINDELGGTFDLDGFAHRAVWNAAASRVEMHLVSLRRQRVRVAAAGIDLTFDPDEWIWTESSHKYHAEAIVADGRRAGFAGGEQWIDAEARFALTRFDVR